MANCLDVVSELTNLLVTLLTIPAAIIQNLVNMVLIM